MCFNGTECLGRSVWCKIYVIREGYKPYSKQFARPRDQKGSEEHPETCEEAERKEGQQDERRKRDNSCDSQM